MAIRTLKDIYRSINRNEFEDLIKQRVIVTEKTAAILLHVQWNNNNLCFFKSGDLKHMTIIDRTITSLYENGIKYINSISQSVIDTMPYDWKFGFEYLPNTNVSTVDYDNIPRNMMILTHIQQVNSDGKITKVLTDPAILNRWAKTFDVQGPSVIFDGYLDTVQRSNLRELLTTDTSQYTRSVFKIFDKNAFKSTLNNTLDKPIDSIILSFANNQKIKSYKLKDPSAPEITKSENHMYQIVVIDMIEYISTINIGGIKLKELSKDRRYIELMSIVFNSYLIDNAVKYIGVNFESAMFAKDPIFGINKTFILNNNTLKYINNKILSELLKIIIGAFRKKKKKADDILSEDIVVALNEIIEMINKNVSTKMTRENKISGYNNFMLNSNLINNDFNIMTFKEFIK